MRGLVAAALVLLVFASAAYAANYSRVLFVNNTNSSESGAVLAYFLAARNITSPNVVNISTFNDSFNITAPDFNSTILLPVKARLQELNASNITIDYIVLTRGIPYVVQDNFSMCEQSSGTRAAAVDNELMLANTAYESYIGGASTAINPAYQSSGTFSRARFGIYLSSRLDAYNLTDIYAMIDRAGSVTNIASGNFVFDRSTGSTSLNTNMQTASTAYANAGLASTLDSPTSQILLSQQNVSFYQSWGSPANPSNRGAPNNTWLNGSIADYLWSFGATNLSGTSNPCATNGSLVGDLIHEGATMVPAFVHEPFTSSAIKVNQVTTRLLAGTLPLASLYYGMNYISWQNIVLGDPLMPYMPERLSISVTPAISNNSAIYSCSGNLAFSASSVFNVSSAIYSINGGANATSQGSSPSIPISSLSDGNNTISIWMVDYDGQVSSPSIFAYNRNYSAGVSAPSLSSPSSGQSFIAENSTSMNISWAYASATGSENYSVYYSANSGSSWSSLANTSSLYYNWNISPLSAGTAYKVMVQLSSPNASCGNDSSAFAINHSSTPAMSSSRLLPSAYSPATDTLIGYCNASDWDFANGYSTSIPAFHWRLFQNSTLNLTGTAGLGFTEFVAGASSSGYQEGAGLGASFYYPFGLAFGSDGYLYVADSSNNRIRKINTTTNQTYLVAGSGNYFYAEGAGSEAHFASPSALAFGADGFLYVADYNNYVIRKINTTTNQTYLVAGDQSYGQGYAEGYRLAARFDSVWGLAFGPDGFLYVADSGNDRIRKINTTTNQTYLVAGDGSSSYAEGAGLGASFYYPFGLAFGTDGFLYVADLYNYVIRKINTTTNQTYLVAGSGSYSYSEGAGSAAGIRSPRALASGNDGYLYFSDEYHVRRLNTTTNQTFYVAGSTSVGNQDGPAAAARFSDIYWLAQGGSSIYLSSNHRISRFLTGEAFSWGSEARVVSLASPSISTNQSWVLECVADDATTNSSALNSSAATNTTAPGISSVSISRIPSDTSLAPAGISGYCTASDYENATITYYYSWHLGGVLQSSGTATGASGEQALVSAYSPVSIGQPWALYCTASDGTYNSSQSSSSYTVLYTYSSTGGGSFPVPRPSTYVYVPPVQNGQDIAPPAAAENRTSPAQTPIENQPQAQPAENRSSAAPPKLALPRDIRAGTTAGVQVTSGGSPVSGAAIGVTLPGGRKLVLVTDSGGRASFFADVPGTYSFSLQGSNETQTIEVLMPEAEKKPEAPPPPATIKEQVKQTISQAKEEAKKPEAGLGIFGMAVVSGVIILILAGVLYFAWFAKKK